MRAAIYARVSTFEQESENPLRELRRYVEARGLLDELQALHPATLTGLVRDYHLAPDTIDAPRVQDYVLDLTHERHLAWSSVSVAASARSPARWPAE